MVNHLTALLHIEEVGIGKEMSVFESSWQLRGPVARKLETNASNSEGGVMARGITFTTCSLLSLLSPND